LREKIRASGLTFEAIAAEAVRYADTHFYRYDDYDRTLVAERVGQFRDQVRRRIAGELTEESSAAAPAERPLPAASRLHAAHRHPLRDAAPAAQAGGDFAQVRPRLRPFHDAPEPAAQLDQAEDAPDALALADVEMHAIQTSGNCIRNITADHFAGAAADEIEDPRPGARSAPVVDLASRIRFLPRKFKIAITGSPNDRAAGSTTSACASKNGQGETGFEVIVGGGLGRTPMIGKTFREFLPRDELLTYLEATCASTTATAAATTLQGAHQDPRARDRRGEDARGVEAEYAAIRGGPAPAGRDHRGDCRAVRAAGAGGAAGDLGAGRGRAPVEPGIRAVARPNVAPTACRAMPSSRPR
jgi:sulfite reductase (NADPH) hemoprotein beta-component